MELTLSQSLDELQGVRSAKLWKRKTMRVRMTNGKVFIFKAAADEKKGYCIPPGQRYYREIVAYEIAKILGITQVPETKVVSIKGRIGALQAYVQGSSTFRHLKLTERYKALQKLPADIRVRCAAFDILIGNSDRNRSNFFIVKESGGNGGDSRLYLIDHGMCLHEKSDTGHVGRLVRASKKLVIPEEVIGWTAYWSSIKDVMRFHKIEPQYIEAALRRLYLLANNKTIKDVVDQWRVGQEYPDGIAEIPGEESESDGDSDEKDSAPEQEVEA